MKKPANRQSILSRVGMFSLLFLILLLASCSGQSSHSNSSREANRVRPNKNNPDDNGDNMAVRMANSELLRTPDAQYLDFRDKPKWEYTNGLMCSAFLKVWKETGDSVYFKYVKAYADSMINRQGEIGTYKKSDYNIDRVNPGKFLIDLYDATGRQNYKIAIDTLREQMREQPRTTEGGFWHKKRYPSQMWLDGIYMGSPFLAKYAAVFNEPALFDEVANQIYLIDKHAYDQETGLYYHGWDESHNQRWADKETGLSANFWGRGMGWLAMAVVDILDYFPKDHLKREMLLSVADKLAQGIIRYQDETGAWYQVINMGDRKGNYLEASASAMFTYFLLKGVNEDYIDSKYEKYGLKGYEGLMKEFIRVDDKGQVNITNVCAVAGLGGDPYRSGSYEYYVNEKKRDNDPKGVAPFIMAALYYQKAQKEQ